MPRFRGKIIYIPPYEDEDGLSTPAHFVITPDHEYLDGRVSDVLAVLSGSIDDHGWVEITT